MQMKVQSFKLQETEQVMFKRHQLEFNGGDGLTRHEEANRREDLDPILLVKRSETTHNQEQPCSRDREG